MAKMSRSEEVCGSPSRIATNEVSGRSDDGKPASEPHANPASPAADGKLDPASLADKINALADRIDHACRGAEKIPGAMPAVSFTLEEWTHLTRALRAKARVRELVVKLYCASGCSCCRNNDDWYSAARALGEMLGIPKDADDFGGYGSGHDFYAAFEEYERQALGDNT